MKLLLHRKTNKDVQDEIVHLMDDAINQLDEATDNLKRVRDQAKSLRTDIVEESMPERDEE